MAKDDAVDEDKGEEDTEMSDVNNSDDKTSAVGGSPRKNAMNEDDDNEDDDDEEDEEDYQFKWQDSGKLRNGRTEYDSVLLTLNETSFRVNKNDFVLLWGVHGDVDEKEAEKDVMDQTIEEIWQSAGCAKVEGMWEKPTKTPGRSKAMFKARWFFQKADLSRIVDEKEIVGNISLEDLKKRMQPREVVESQEVGTYLMNTIGGPARVFFRGAPTGDEPTQNEATLPKDAFMCRYSLKKTEKEETVGGTGKKGSQRNIMEIVPYEPDISGEEESDDHDTQRRSSKRLRRNENESDSDTMEEGESSGQDGSSSDEESRAVPGEGGEGATMGKIRLGPKYQVPVPPFDPNAKISSRSPTLVWSSSKSPKQEVINDYFQKAAAILTPFAKQQLLVAGAEPFTLTPPTQAEGQKRTREPTSVSFVTFVSTASSLASLPPENSLGRESDVDALLKNLHDQNYDVESAIKLVAASPREYLSKWTVPEREGFDTAFRTDGGSLRAVAKSLSSLSSDKTHCEVVDYYYRFKIPGQFRRYRDKMREQAVRMMECIETKTFQENKEVPVTQSANRGGEGGSTSVADNRSQGGAKGAEVGSWSETGTGDVTHAVEERRSDAKQLLLDIQRELGKEKMAEVSGAIISLNQGSETQSKGALLRILKNQPELHQRLVEFLPRRFWK